MDQGFDKICLPKQGFVILRFFSIYLQEITGVKKSFIILRTLFHGGLFYWGSTVSGVNNMMLII